MKFRFLNEDALYEFAKTLDTVPIVLEGPLNTRSSILRFLTFCNRSLQKEPILLVPDVPSSTIGQNLYIWLDGILETFNGSPRRSFTPALGKTFSNKSSFNITF